MADQLNQHTTIVKEQKTLGDATREYLTLGWSVIPLLGKLPAIPWKVYQARCATPEEVEAWFSSETKPTGVGIVTGILSGLVVVDCDAPDDAEFWQASFPSSPLTVSTGGGGVHVYYRMPKDNDVRNRIKILGRRIDVRGEGGYATSPPSLHPSGKQYAWLSFDTNTMLPEFDADWLIDKSQPARLSNSKQTSPVRNAVAYIRRIQARAGEGGHNATFRAACKLRDAGLSAEEALIVLSDWNETNATPPWSLKDLRHKVCSAFDSAVHRR
ncbi:bifunctional DNA primase/polymerase [Bythopirellula goksoeyrii]|uniref:DNA primase/polymerase bifunctional N-terminal domain-containing protein n=1 Tax=Bythopirellula goksoeyrii TaxID=1400387 RepID=A0A5B9QAY8_9BACT|nr:bifunctional DNA primase/polymerase [Bythopirellula goksoeyrii]QEG36088.1 hypothetical protein Pr1d_33970 [Bythopirellula goksoeyrii]